MDDLVRSSAEMRALRWLEGRLNKHPSPFCELIEICPAKAKALLDINTVNRSVKTKRVREMSDLMASGRWPFNGQSIVISRFGEMKSKDPETKKPRKVAGYVVNDGQHRLNAIVESGTAQKFVVVWGVDPDSRFTTDQGTPKQGAHLLEMDGERDATPARASIAARLLEWVDHRRISRAGIYRPYEIKEFYDDCEDKIENALAFVRSQPGRDLYGSEVAPALCFAILSDIDSDDADEFMSAVITGAGLKESSVILKARNKILSDKETAVRNRFQYSIAHYTATVFSAWNYYRAGKEPVNFRVSKKEFPIPC